MTDTVSSGMTNFEGMTLNCVHEFTAVYDE